MIEIIEKGPEKFFVTCQKCGVEFSYELEDLQNGLLLPYVRCPICGERCFHIIDSNVNTNLCNSNKEKQVVDSKCEEIYLKIDEMIEYIKKYEGIKSFVDTQLVTVSDALRDTKMIIHRASSALSEVITSVYQYEKKESDIDYVNNIEFNG